MAYESPPLSKSQFWHISFSSKSRCKNIWNSIPVWSERIVLGSIFEMSDICQFLCLYVFHQPQSVLIVSNSPQCPMATFDRRKIKLLNPCRSLTKKEFQLCIWSARRLIREWGLNNWVETENKRKVTLVLTSDGKSMSKRRRILNSN